MSAQSLQIEIASLVVSSMDRRQVPWGAGADSGEGLGELGLREFGMPFFLLKKMGANYCFSKVRPNHNST